MKKRFPEYLEESKSVNISLAASVFTVIIITFIGLVSEFVRVYIPQYTHWLEKIVILVVLCLFLRAIVKNNEFIKKCEGFLLLANKKKK